MGVSPSGFEMALEVMGWAEYERDEKDFTDGKGGFLGMIRFHVAPANVTWLPATASAELDIISPTRSYNSSNNEWNDRR